MALGDVPAGGTWSYGGTSEPTDPDYAAQNELLIAKLEGNPEAQAAMQAAYDNRTDQSGSIIGGIVKAVVSPVGAYFDRLANVSTSFVEPFRNEEEGEEDTPLVDMWQGLVGDENTRWSENLASYNIGLEEGDKATTGIGLALDIFADPTSYLGAGRLGQAKNVVAKGARLISERAAKDVLQKEIADVGGIVVNKGVGTIDAENVGKVVRAAGTEQVKGLGLHDDLVDVAGVLKGVQADEMLLKSMDELTQAQAAWVGTKFGNASGQRGGIKALLAQGGTIEDPWGKVWNVQELLDVFTKTSRLNPKQLAEMATHVYGGAQKRGTAGMLGRTAAAAEGGIRMKFGVPFSKRLGDRFDSPWLGYRWQSKALPYSSRFHIMGKDYGASEMGNFFRGISGVQKLDTLIAKSGRFEDGIWTAEDSDAFMRGGFAGLRTHATKTGKHLAFSQEFGNKATSSFIMASERAGRFTGNFSKGSQMWRRMGIAGMDLQDEFRDAAQGKKLFREAASKHEREWSIAERQFNKEVASGAIDGGVVNKAANAYLEGRSNDLSSVPRYMQKSIEEMKKGFPEILEMVRAEGVPVGDATEVLNRVRQDDIIKLSREKLGVLVNQRETLMTNMEAAAKAGSKDGGAAANALGDVNTKIGELDAQIKQVLTDQRGAEVEISTMEKYDEILHGLRGVVPGDKATPFNYFHRRMNQKSKDALEGVYVAAGNNYGDAKQLRATLERVLSGMGLEEATEYMKKAHPEALGALDEIFEESSFRVMNSYINDMSEAVYRARAVRAVQHAMGALGGIDNGLAMRTTVKLPEEYMDEGAELVGSANLTGKAKVKYKSAEEAMQQVGIAIGADIEKTAHDAGTAAWGIRQKWRGTTTPTLPAGVSGWSMAGRAINTAKQQTGKVAEYMNRADLEDLIDTEDYAKAVRELDADPVGTAKKLEKLKKEGFDAPIQIDYDPRTGATLTTDGHHRLELAKRLFESGVDEAQYIPTFFKRFNPREVNSNALEGVGGKAPKRLGIEEVESKFVSKNRQLLDEMFGNTHLQGDIPGYTPEVFSPSSLFTKRAGRAGMVGKLTETQAEGLDLAMRGMNRITAQANGLVTPQTKAMWQEVGLDVDKTKWGVLDAPELRGWVAHPFMAAEFNRMYKGMKGATGMHKWYREVVLGPWKKAATIFFPGFHVRNFVGGAFNNMLGGVTVDDYHDAVRLHSVLKNGDQSEWFGKTYQGSMVLDGKVRKNVTYGQLTKIMKDSAIVSGSALSLADTRLLLGDEGYSSIRAGRRVVAEKAHIGKFGEYQSEMWGRVTYAEAAMRRFEQAGIGATTGIENFHRSAAFLQGLKQGGGDVAGARTFTMMRHGDYDELTDMEAVIRDVVPFYKWMRTNIPFQIKMMLENPAKQLAVGDVQNALIDDDTRKKYSDYLNQGMVIPIPGPLKKLIGAGEGPAALTMQLPLHDAVLSGSEFVSSMLPVIKNVAEVAIIKKNLYSGAPLGGEETTPTPGFMDAIGLSWSLEKVGLVHKGPKGYYTTDRVNHLAAVFPLYARAKDYISADPEREGIRSAAFLSAVIGMRPEELGQKALDDGEKDWHYNILVPEYNRLRDAGYVMPTAYDLGMATNQQSGYTPEAPTAGLGTGGL